MAVRRGRSLAGLVAGADSETYPLHWPPTHKGGQRIILGLNTRADATAASPVDVISSTNVYFRESAITRRGGLKQWLSSPLSSPVRSFAWGASGVITTRFLAFANKTAYLLNNTLGSVGTDTTAGFTVDTAVSTVNYLGSMYCVNGADFKKYDIASNAWSNVVTSGGAGNDFANAAACKFITGSHDRLIAAGNAAFGHLVYVSEIADATTWKTTNELSCDSGDGTAITALINYDDWIVVSKPYSMFTFQPAAIGTASLAMYQLNNNFGIPSGATAKTWANGVLIFQSFDGNIYGLYRSALNKEFIQPTLLSQRISGSIANLDPSTLAQASAVIHNGFYKLWINGREFWLDLMHSDLRNGERCIWAQMDWGSYDQPVRFIRPDTQKMFGGGAAGDGQVYQHDNGDLDVNSQIVWNLNSPWLDAGKPEIYKLIERFSTFAKATFSANSSYTFYVDSEGSVSPYSVNTTPSGGFVLGSSKIAINALGVSNEVSQYANSTGGTGRRFRLRWNNNIDGGPIVIRGATLHLVDISQA